MRKIGILLLNLGTPAAPTTQAVRRYLREFLHDPRVIDLPAALRRVLVDGLILPFRPQRSAKAYQQIWQPEGSPLLVNSQRLCTALAQALGENYAVNLGMRYGQPDIGTAVQKLLAQNCQKLIILPLFPQYSSAATGSALEKVMTVLQQINSVSRVSFQDNLLCAMGDSQGGESRFSPLSASIGSAERSIKIIHSFYDHPAFIQAWQAVVREQYPVSEPDVWLLSYHSLPLQHLRKIGCQPEACILQDHCPASRQFNCYRSQCLTTSRLLTQALQIPPDRYRVVFQSRLGRTKWITPQMDQLLPELIQQGIRSVAVVCPSFTADCLETLEEIGIRAKAQWQALGGGGFTLISSLNAHPAWVSGLKAIIGQESLS